MSQTDAAKVYGITSARVWQIVHGWQPRTGPAEPRPHWTFRLLAERLAWVHGPERAVRIMSGKDEATNEDIRKWRALGR